MEIIIHHLSGSRSGEKQVFSERDPIGIGRNPDLDITFDPYEERVVSATHAEITNDGGRWLLRDKSSTNGTFVGGERITSERVLRTNDIIEVGKGGPRLRVQFSGAEGETFPTTMLSSEMPHGGAPAIGGTVMMSLKPQQSAPGRSQPPAAVYRPIRSKTRGPSRALFVVIGVLLALVLVAFLGAFAMRQRNLRRRGAVADVQRKVEQAKADHAERTAEVVATEQKVKNAEAAGNASPEELAQLKLELDAARGREQKYQEIEQNLTTELQSTNEKLNAANSRKPEVRYRYVPVPQTVPVPQLVPVPVPQPVPVPVPQPVSVPQPAPATPVETRVAPPIRAPTSPSPAGGSMPVADAVVQRTIRSPDAAIAQPYRQPAASVPPSPTRVEMAAPETVEPAESLPAYPGKVLKRKFSVTSVPSPIPIPGMPSNMVRELAVTLGGALESTGRFVNDPRAPLAVAIAVLDFHSESHVIDPKKTANAVAGIGRIFGKNLPNNPVDTARSASYAASMSLNVELFDTAGRLVTATHPTAQASNRQSSFSVSGVSLSQVILSDTALGDVSRKVVADSVEALMPALLKVEWSAPIISQHADGVVVAAGRNAGVEVGDVMEAVDTRGRVMGRLRVSSVAYETAEMEIVSGPSKKLGPRVRFVGSERAPAATADRWFVTLEKTLAFDGPGISYRQVRSVPSGLKVRYDYVVGSWARVSDGGTPFWVRMTAGRIATE
jgi:pSer/pThr/pTyr-binding forkhead associated (FHA) protein